MNNMRSALFLPLLLAGLVSVSHGGRDDTATNPSDFNVYYAPAYQLPDVGSSCANPRRHSIVTERPRNLKL